MSDWIVYICIVSRSCFHELLGGKCRALREALGTGRWAVPLIHGFWQQRTLAVMGQQLTVTLVARRSRFFAGTRFQKRGVNHEARASFRDGHYILSQKLNMLPVLLHLTAVNLGSEFGSLLWLERVRVDYEGTWQSLTILQS